MNSRCAMPATISELHVGLDRVYLRSPQGPLVAIDPRTGAALDLGPLPSSPRVASIAALDAWRAIAVADLRGALLTIDAGSSWRPVTLPVEPTQAVALDGAFAVGGLDRPQHVDRQRLAQLAAWPVHDHCPCPAPRLVAPIPASTDR